MNKILSMLAVGTLVITANTLPTRADSLSATATISPAAPQTGDNTLDLSLTNSDGKPATGLKLTTSVAMTSMDMGTTHPVVTEVGGGHYRAKVNFSMDGPWRVIVRGPGGKITSLDFDAGAKTPWKAAQAKSTPVPTETPPMAGMDMSGMTGIADMKTAVMPQLKQTGTYVVKGDEDWAKQTGFGQNAGMVGMMNQMMVGGSGMEGMKMPAMDMKFDEKTYAKPDPEDTADGMAGMKMDTPPVKPDIPAVKPDIPAAKPDIPATKPDAPPVKQDAPAASGPVKITAVTTSAPKSGDNPLTISVIDAQGKPVTGAKITASVAMTSMDMGTTHPAVTEKGAGQYAATVNFSMAGPWRVKVKITASGQKPQIKAFDFTAK